MPYAELEETLLEFVAGCPGDDAAFGDLALRVYRFQREHNAPYRAFCESLDAATVRSWRDIPAVPTSAFRYAPLRCFPAEKTALAFRTSGTTGEGFGTHFFASPRLYEASILRRWEMLALPRWPQVILAQHPQHAPHSSLSYMLGALGALAPQTWCLDAKGRLDATIFRQGVAGKTPVLLLGTALAFLHLFERLGDETLRLPAGSLAMETGGYKGTGRTLSKATLYEKFAEKLALPADAILNEYSMTELSSQWYTRGLGGAHTGGHWTRALVVDLATGQEAAEGETGLLRLFDLANLGSVLAIQTQDLAVRRGAGVELIGRDPMAIPRGCSRAADERLNA